MDDDVQKQFWRGEGRACDGAAWWQSLRIEAGLSRGEANAAILLDLEKACELAMLGVCQQRAEVANFPAQLLGLATAGRGACRSTRLSRRP